MLRDDEVQRSIVAAGEHYAGRNEALVSKLDARGVQAQADSGLNVWVDVRDDATKVGRRLASRGWLVRPGSEFALDTESAQGSTHLRLTVHALDDAETQRLVDDLVAVAGGSHSSGADA